MNNLTCTGYKSKNSNALTFTIKLASFQAVLSLLDRIKLDSIPNVPHNNPSYIPHIISSTIMDCVQKIKPELQQRTISRFTTNLALGIGIITSAFVSSGFDGMDYFIIFTLNLIKTSCTTIIVEKLNKLKIIDGVSLVILLDFLMQIPGMITQAASQGFMISILFIISIGLMLKVNYELLKQTTDTSINLKGKPFTLSLSGRGSYNSALLISSMVSGLIQNSVTASVVMLILNPIIMYVLNSSYNETSDELNKYLSQSGLHIDKVRHGSETKKYIDKMLKRDSAKVGVVGAVIFIISSLVINVFSASCNPLTLAIVANSFMNVQYSIKAIKRAKHVKQIIKI